MRVSDPVDPRDAVNKQYLEANTPSVWRGTQAQYEDLTEILPGTIYLVQG